MDGVCYYKGIDNACECDDDSKQQQKKAPDSGSNARRVLPCVACLIVAGHFAACTYRAARDPRDLAFAAVEGNMVALLLYSIGRFDALADDGSPAAEEARELLKLPIWALSTALSALFSARVAPMMPPPPNAPLVAMALVVAVGGMCLLFILTSAMQGTTSRQLLIRMRECDFS